MRKYLCAALSPQTCKKRLRTALPPQRRENACALRSRRKHAKTTAHCAPAANLQKAPAHRRVPFVRSSPCVIAPSRSPYFGHFVKVLQNVSKVRCSLVWAIMNSSAETLAALATHRHFVLFRLMRHGSATCCTWKMPAACRRDMHGSFARHLRCAGFLYFFALCGMALQRAAHGKCLQLADAICIAISRGTCGAQAYVYLRSCVVSLRRTLSPPTAYL